MTIFKARKVLKTTSDQDSQEFISAMNVIAKFGTQEEKETAQYWISGS